MVPMTYREIQYLADSYEFRFFTKKYNLKSKVLNNEKLLIISDCLIFEIYGLVVEDFFYFDLYSIDLKFCSTLNRLLTAFDSKILQTVYETQTKQRKRVLIPIPQISQLQSNLDLTLKSEVYFFTMLQLMDELLSDILLCKKNINKKHLTETFDFKKKELEHILFND
jgi:hypothetical protein